MHGSLISQQDNAKEKQQWKAAAFIMAQQAFLNYQENRRNSQLCQTDSRGYGAGRSDSLRNLYTGSWAVYKGLTL